MPSRTLKEILNQGRIGKIKDNIAFLEESSKDAELNNIKINGLKNNYLLLKMDKVDTQTLYLSKKGENMRCDYLLVTDNIVYFIEIKSNKKSDTIYKEESIKKFRAVECILDYIDSVLLKFYNIQNYFKELEKRYILFYLGQPIQFQPSLSKKIEIESKTKNDKPENMKKYSVQNASIIDIRTLIN
jgi:hypothetical protein